MAELSYDRLSDTEIADRLVRLPGWTVEHGALTRLYTFPTYASGVVFASAVGYLADALNHHPDLTIGYQKVRVTLTTHDAGGGLTAYDFELARRIDERLG
ncbi:MAG TPA: 4a-hydroxytetrahydrobiopterin dehydratase [Fimbriimonadaceae bacterium]|nr:4a-hydroxytetrahydrobiopterin dehydratase [Fimbriimonadaceae bacterium]HRJ97147.1 4a-hydroxytetrahydrobiopterin dehydratase [Fimbriimonadaceae bacterium]